MTKRLLREVEDEALEEMEGLMEGLGFDEAQLALHEWAYEHRDLCRMLLSSPSSSYVERSKELVRRRNEEGWGRSGTDPETVGRFFSFSNGGGVAAKRPRLYQLDPEYVRQLAAMDRNVLSNAPSDGKTNRPFVGIVIPHGEIWYCMPAVLSKAQASDHARGQGILEARCSGRKAHRRTQLQQHDSGGPERSV